MTSVDRQTYGLLLALMVTAIVAVLVVLVVGPSP